jgi:hypothetical protein
MAKAKLQAPFPYFGGKSRIADAAWERFGDVDNAVEPFFGSGAVLLRAPWPSKRLETINDLDGMCANFWRAVTADPGTTAKHADWPVNENDQHARHAWLVGQKDAIQAKLEGDPDYYDARIAGWWAWGMCCWIGSGFCSGKGPWHVVNGELVREPGHDGDGQRRKLPRLGDAGRGVNRQPPQLGNAGRGVNRQRPHLGDAGMGVNRKRPNISGLYGIGVGVNKGVDIYAWFNALSARLRRVRVCCGDWSRVCGPSVTFNHGMTAVFLDPPYTAEAGRNNKLYRVESTTVGHDVCAWAIANGDNPLLRIALCGYEGEYTMPKAWECLAWKAQGGYSCTGKGDDTQANSRRERVWFSPACLRRRMPLAG